MGILGQLLPSTPMRLAVLLFVLLPLTACAQTAPVAGLPEPGALTPAEAAVAEVIAGEGIHVVHLWAPWCGNSTAEFRAGWYTVIEDHPEVSFSFVTIWNDGERADETLARYGIPDRVLRLAQPDLGPSDVRANRRRTFLGLPVTWTPTTWVFREGGQLAVAFNYGEVSPEQLTEAIALARADWTHD